MNHELKEAYKSYCKRHSVTMMEHTEQGLIDRVYLAGITTQDTAIYKEKLLAQIIDQEIKMLDMDLSQEVRNERLRKLIGEFRESYKLETPKQPEKQPIKKAHVYKKETVTIANGYRFVNLDFELVKRAQKLIDLGYRMPKIAKKLGQELNTLKLWYKAKLIKIELNIPRDRTRITPEMVQKVQNRLDKFICIKQIENELGVEHYKICQLLSRGVLTKPSPKIEIIKRLEAGETLDQIADFFGISKASLLKKCYNLDIKTRDYLRVPCLYSESLPKLEQFNLLVSEGWSRHAAGKKVGISNSTIQRWLNTGIIKRANKKHDHDQICELVSKGFTLQQVAEQVGLSYGYLRNLLFRLKKKQK